MLQSFTRNYEDNSTEAGYQFTFYCDLCHDGYKSSFIESETYKKGKGLRNLSRGAGALGSLLEGRLGHIGYSLERGGDVLAERFHGMNPEWHKEHEKAFEMANNQVRQLFNRCHGCRKWVCDSCYNEDEGLCTECAPRQDVWIAKARAEAMQRNIEEAAENATVWKGKLERKTIVCSNCGKPAGSGKFCNNCGSSLALLICPQCKAENAQGVRFCNNCGSSMTEASKKNCPACGESVSPGAKFCGNCGNKI